MVVVDDFRDRSDFVDRVNMSKFLKVRKVFAIKPRFLPSVVFTGCQSHFIVESCEI